MSCSIVARIQSRIASSDALGHVLFALYMGEHVSRDVITVATAIVRALREGDMDRARSLAEDVVDAYAEAMQRAGACELAARGGKLLEALSFAGWELEKSAPRSQN